LVPERISELERKSLELDAEWDVLAGDEMKLLEPLVVGALPLKLPDCAVSREPRAFGRRAFNNSSLATFPYPREVTPCSFLKLLSTGSLESAGMMQILKAIKKNS
jgi:hypothetical protein